MLRLRFHSLAVAALMLPLIPSTGYAQSDDEKKAIEEIERRAEEEKKKAIEKLKKKREEAEKKKAEADKKKAEREQKKAEADAKKQAERDKKKAEEERKKAEKEGRKPPEPAAELPPQPPQPPPPTPASPAAEPLPDAVPVDRAGDARWTGVGFVQQGEAAPTGEGTASPGVKVPGTLGALGMNRGHFLFGMGVARFNPINDDVTDDETAFNLANPSFRFGYEFRNLGSLFAPWFDLSMGMLFGSRKHVPPGGTLPDDPYELSVFALQLAGRVGVDLAPVDIFSAGPFVGYRFEVHNIKLARESETPTSCTADSDYIPPGENCNGTINGLEYGLHARFRTRAAPGEAERFYLDGIYGWRKSEFQTTTNIELEAGIRAGDVFFVGWYHKRLGSSGSFTVDDIRGDSGQPDIGEAAAKSMPIEQRIGGGIALIF